MRAALNLSWMLAAVLLVGLAQAVTLSNTTLNATSSNITATFTVSVTADLVNVTTTQISLSNVTVNNSIGSVKSSVINLTTGNTTTDSAAFPVLASSSSNVKTITSSLSTNVSAFVNLSTGGIVPSSPLLVHPDGSSEYPSYLYDSVDQTITFDASIQPGVSTLTISNTVASTDSICTNGTRALGELASWLPIIALLIGAVIVIGVLTGFGGITNTPEISYNNIGQITVLIVFTTVVVAVAASVLTSILC